MLGDPDEVHPAGLQVDGEQDVVTSFAQQAPHINGEEMGGSKQIHMLGDEDLPRRVRAEQFNICSQFFARAAEAGE